MRRCLHCNTLRTFQMYDCPGCEAHPELVDGFEAYAPNLAHEGGGFKGSYFTDLARLEDNNFWFRSRNKLILWALKEYYPDFGSFLEVGCGTGYVLSAVAKTFPQSRLYGSEIFTAGLMYAFSRLPSVKLMQMDARDIPFVDEFDIIGAFDVLEHIEEDELVLRQLYSAMKPQGIVLITVPQHQWLWSVTDDYAFHVRRYSGNDLRFKIEKAGFCIIRDTSFVSILLPAMLISRLLQRQVKVEQFDGAAELKTHPLLNFIFYALLAVERCLIGLGIDFPVGGSRFVVAKKN